MFGVLAETLPQGFWRKVVGFVLLASITLSYMLIGVLVQIVHVIGQDNHRLATCPLFVRAAHVEVPTNPWTQPNDQIPPESSNQAAETRDGLLHALRPNVTIAEST